MVWESLEETIPISPLLIYNPCLHVANGPFSFKVFIWEIIKTNEFVGI
jgi:hypothetical protein